MLIKDFKVLNFEKFIKIELDVLEFEQQLYFM